VCAGKEVTTVDADAGKTEQTVSETHAHQSSPNSHSATSLTGARLTEAPLDFTTTSIEL